MTNDDRRAGATRGPLARATLSVAFLAPATDVHQEPVIGAGIVVVRGKGSRQPTTGKVDPTRIRPGLSLALGESSRGIEWLEGPCAASACWVDLAGKQGMTHVLLSVFERREPDVHITLELVEVASDRVVATVERTCELCGAEEIARTAAELGARLVPMIEALDERLATLIVEGKPIGATIEIDGQPIGTLPWEGPLEPGEHRIRLTHPDHFAAERVVKMTDGVRERVDMMLQPLPPRVRRPWLGLGVASLAVGASLVGGGSALIAIDERDYEPRCAPDALGNCSHRYDTLAGGISLAVSGAILLGTGIALLVVDRRARTQKVRARSGRSSHGWALAF